MTTSSLRLTDRLDSREESTASNRRHWWTYAVGVPFLLYALTRVVQLSLIVLMADDTDGRTLAERLVIWDSGFFVRLADEGYESGYSYDDQGKLVGNGLAFFPVYPLLIRTVAWLPGVSTPIAALAVSWVAGAVAAILLSLLGTRLWSRRTGYALAVLFGAQPMSVVLSMAYTEAVFCALVAASLLALHHNAWLYAGTFAALAGLTRPTGVALAGALALAGAWWWWRERTRTDYPRWRVAVGVLTSLAATPLFLLWVGLRVGELDGWFRMQEQGWGTKWDFGSSTARFLADTFTGDDGWVGVSTAVIIVGAAVALLVAFSERVWLPLSLYGLFAFAMAVGSSGYFHSRPRMLVPVILLLVPLAVALGRCRRRTAVVVSVSAVLLGCWYGAYMITVWPYTI